MKYIEELKSGEAFVSENSVFILTIDFKKNGSRLAINLSSGEPKWFNSDSMIDVEPLYRLDKDNNIVPIKQYSKDETIS